MSTESISLREARAMALAAQGMAGQVTRASGADALRAHADRLGIIQLDSVNVFARAHLMPLFSRVGAYRLDDVAELLGVPRQLSDSGVQRTPGRTALPPFVEYFGHEASVVPHATRDLLRFRMQDFRERFQSREAEWREHEAIWHDIHALLKQQGPLTAAQARTALGQRVPEKKHWGWNYSLAGRALQFRFLTGDVVSVGRNAQFERLYDALESHPQLSETRGLDRATSVRELMRIALRAHGVGTLTCFADYFRLHARDARPALADLVETGEAVPVQVKGWDAPVYRYREASVPASLGKSALLSPFDPVVWERKRLQSLFGMHYRIEIYVPAAQREFGYYCLPFVHRGAMAGRVDLKSDRSAGELVVKAAHFEPGATPGARDAMRREIERAAVWQGLERVRYEKPLN